MTDNTSNFNENSLAAVINRVNAIDVLQEPLLIKVEGGRYVVHERTGIEFLSRMGMDQRDDIVSYGPDEFAEKYGDRRLMTYDQYVYDQKTLSNNRMDGSITELTRSQFQYMDARIEEIQKDMAEAGETFEILSPKVTLDYNQ
jgi:hypothetical protein